MNMDINELDKFKLSDAVKFHDMLNPSLWEDNRLDNEVRNQLVLIAKEFVTYLGIKDLSVKDITVSGSNAAYSYTPHSDLDLHILVDFNDLPDNEVYQELFTAKKTLFNDAHDITVHGVPVECYVQDINEPVVSIGQYSVLHDRWIKAPKKSRANFDHTETKQKYEQLARLVELALKTHDLVRVNKVLDIIKRYRRAGLSKGGEFSPENLAYKAIRTQNGIQDLYDLRNDLESQKLSIEEAVGSKEDAIKQIKKISNVSGRTPNEIETIEKMIKNLMTSWDINPRELGIYTKEPVRNVEPEDPLKAKIAKAAYEKQMAMDKLKAEWNNFKRGWFAEGTINEVADQPYRFISPVSTATTQKSMFKTDSGSTIQVFIQVDIQNGIADIGFYDATDKDNPTIKMTGKGDAFRIFGTVGSIVKQFVDKRKPQYISFSGKASEAGRIKLYDMIAKNIGRYLPEYKLINSGDTTAYGDKGYMFKRITDEKSNDITEASGYIPSAKEKNDPRFKTALTVDVKPDAIKKNAKAFGFNTSRAGIPPQARADGKIK